MNKARQLIFISGRSGAGKATLAHALEDMGYFVVDNLLPQLFQDFLKIAESSEKYKKTALVIDVRDQEFLENFTKLWALVNTAVFQKKIIFLDATDDVLHKRFQASKRKHPLDNGQGLNEALNLENEQLKSVRALAHEIISTDDLNPYDLKNLCRNFLQSDQSELNCQILSFGFKNGLPKDLDLCFDVRFLKNPYYDSELKALSGMDPKVSTYVFAQKEAQDFFAQLIKFLDFLYPLFVKEGKASLVIAIGCTGGRHRSVAMAEALGQALQAKISKLRVVHRDIELKTATK